MREGVFQISISGHWFNPETAEQYIATIGSLQQRVAETYDNVVKRISNKSVKSWKI